MSDQPPPPKPKPGSLRDRIAAFEKSSSAASAPTPVPRPKPGGVAWKPKPVSPPTSPGSSVDHGTTTERKIGSMSASDAKESIGKAGSLKDRMAALQGKGAFGAPPPPVTPKPASDKPKWKPPPVIPRTPEDSKNENEAEARVSSKPSPAAAESSERDSVKSAGEGDSVPAADDDNQVGADPDEEERQRRAAIAARMARLGGARVGMAPTVFGRKVSIPKEEDSPGQATGVEGEKSPQHGPADDTSVKSPPSDETSELALTKADAEPAPDHSITNKKSEASLRSIDSGSQATRTSSSMPVPAVPRRAGPPRKKVSKPTEAEPTPTSEGVPATTDVPPGGQQGQLADDGGEEREREGVQKHVEPVLTQEPAKIPDAHEPKVEGRQVDHVEETHKEVPIVDKEDITVAEDQQERLVSPNIDEVPVSTEAEKPEHGLTDEQEITEDSIEAEDEASRRKRVAERLAKTGGINPLAAPLPPRRQSSSSSDDSSAVSPTVHRRTSQKRDINAAAVVESAPSPSHGSVESTGSHAAVSDSAPRRDHDENTFGEAKGLKYPPIGPDDDEEFSDEISGQRQASDSGRERADESVPPEGPTHNDEAIHGEAEIVPSPPPRRPKVLELHAIVEAANASSPRAMAQFPEDLEPASATLSLRSPLGGVPTIPEDEDEETDEPDPVHATSPSRSIPPPPTLQQTESTTSARPSRLIPPPPPIVEEEAEQQEDSNGFVSNISSVPPPGRRPMPLSAQSPIQQSIRSPTSPGQPSLPQSTPSLSVSDQEVLDDDEGDPIDPAFHTPSRQPSNVSLREAAAASQIPEPSDEISEDGDQVRRRTIAERMAKLGGIKFGTAPVPSAARGGDGSPAQPAAHAQEDTPEQSDLTEEEEEQARKQRIAAKLAGMGGMRLGMVPLGVGGLPPQQSRTLKDNSGESPRTVPSPPPPPQRAAPPPRPPPPPQPQDIDSEHDSPSTSEDGVKVEAEESELEEVKYEDAEETQEAPPPVPTRAGRASVPHPKAESPSRTTSPTSPTRGSRPPVPSALPNRRPSTKKTSPTSRTSSVESSFSHSRAPSTPTRQPQLEYVMVEEPKAYGSDDAAPSPPARPTGRAPPRGVPPPPPPPPPPAADPADSVASQWELPSIPSSSLEFGAQADLSLSWSEDSTAYTKSTSPPPASENQTANQAIKTPRSRQGSSSDESKLSSDELMAVWGRVGVQICEVATSLFEKSKKSLVGDGTYHGFVQAVLDEVPNAGLASPSSYGYTVYLQVGASVQKRASEIMPGDIIIVRDAKFKGHKGIQVYNQTVGMGEPLVAVVSEVEPKKSKIRAFQANQHVGQQTVESASYRLEDLKSGTIEISRVLEG